MHGTFFHPRKPLESSCFCLLLAETLTACMHFRTSLHVRAEISDELLQPQDRSFLSIRPFTGYGMAGDRSGHGMHAGAGEDLFRLAFALHP